MMSRQNTSTLEGSSEGLPNPSVLDLESAASEAVCRLRVVMDLLQLSEEEPAYGGYGLSIVMEQLDHLAQLLDASGKAAAREREDAA